ncbi:MAG: glycosyltransferase family 39 protein [Gemmatimonadetes bacterium]|nr:glycosyltransferase family 39 protein [Gemmatimonadota bacterium]
MLVALAGLGVLLSLAHRLSADEGQILTGAWNLYNGQELYRDFFEFIGPASFTWVGGFFRVFGPSYWVALLASQTLLLMSIWAFFLCSRLLIEHRPTALATSAIWVLIATTPPFINHNSYSSFLASAFLLMMIRTLKTRRLIDAFLAGVLGGVTVFFLQPKGGILLIVGLVTLPWLGMKSVGDAFGGTRVESGPAGSRDLPGRRSIIAPPVASYLGGAAVVGVTGLVFWGLNPAQAVFSMARGTVAMNHLSLSYLPLLGFLSIAGLIGFASQREGLLDSVGKLLVAIQAGLWLSTAHLPDLWHLWINSFPLLLMVGRLGGRSLNRPLAPAVRGVIAGLFGIVLMAGVGQSVVRNLDHTRVTRSWISGLNDVLGGEEFFAFTFLPSFYLEFRVPNPYYNSVLYVGNHPPEHFQRNLETLSDRRPPFVLLDYASVEKYGHTLENPIDRFLRRNYRRAQSIPHGQGTIEVWERL